MSTDDRHRPRSATRGDHTSCTGRDLERKNPQLDHRAFPQSLYPIVVFLFSSFHLSQCISFPPVSLHLVHHNWLTHRIVSYVRRASGATITARYIQNRNTQLADMTNGVHPSLFRVLNAPPLTLESTTTLECQESFAVETSPRYTSVGEGNMPALGA